MVHAASDACERLSAPDAELALAPAVIYLAMAPKSNAGASAFIQAMVFVKNDKPREVPGHLRKGSGKPVEHGLYACAAGESYLPTGMREPGWYAPVPRGLATKIAEKLAWLRGLDEGARAR